MLNIKVIKSHKKKELSFSSVTIQYILPIDANDWTNGQNKT